MAAAGRSPHGERGLKFSSAARSSDSAQSLPTRGAWIEIRAWADRMLLEYGRSPHGERGLKFSSAARSSDSAQSLPTRGAWIEIRAWADRMLLEYGRSPHGERGLKFFILYPGIVLIAVAPHTGSVD